MGAVGGILALWLAFAASHMGLSSPRLRPRLVERLGERGFQAVYSVLALAIFVPLVGLYFDHPHAGPPLWYLGGALAVRTAAIALMTVALTLALGGVTRPSPSSLVPGRPEARGLFRITRHPLLMGIALFGGAHLLAANVHLGELVFFGGFLLFSPIGAWHQDQRKLAAGDEAFRSFHAQTPFLPFSGPGALRGLMERPVAAVLGAVATGVLRHFHPAWFGGAA